MGEFGDEARLEIAIAAIDEEFDIPAKREEERMSTWTQPTPDQTTVKVLLYGKSGMGKTRAAGTINRDPKNVDTLVLNTEGGGWQTIKQQLGYTPFVVDVQKWADMEEAVRQLEVEPGPINNVILDSVTELAIVALDDIVGNRQPRIQDFGTLSKRLQGILRRLRDLPMNVIITALSGDVKRDDIVVGEEPAIMGGTKNVLPALVDAVIYVCGVEDAKGRTQYMAQTVPAKGRIAKVRGAAMPAVVPTDDLWGLIGQSFGLEGFEIKTAPADPATETSTETEESNA